MRSDIPGWTLKVDEFSPGVFRVTLTDKNGRKAEVIDNATDKTISLAKDYAFDIERQLKKTWNKFLYDFCLLNLEDCSITSTDYNSIDFGSWVVELNTKRLVYDGREFWLVHQIKENGGWTDNTLIKDEELKYSKFKDLIEKLRG
jgi:uncharacterized protein YdiU (UPF0061 family)